MLWPVFHTCTYEGMVSLVQAFLVPLCCFLQCRPSTQPPCLSDVNRATHTRDLVCSSSLLFFRSCWGFDVGHEDILRGVEDLNIVLMLSGQQTRQIFSLSHLMYRWYIAATSSFIILLRTGGTAVSSRTLGIYPLACN